MSATQTIKLDGIAVNRLFSEAKNCGEAISGVYRMVHPNLDSVRLDNYPICSPETWELICELCIAKDDLDNRLRPLDKQVMKGGGWMNCGFSTSGPLSKSLARWEVIPAKELPAT